MESPTLGRGRGTDPVLERSGWFAIVSSCALSCSWACSLGSAAAQTVPDVKPAASAPAQDTGAASESNTLPDFVAVPSRWYAPGHALDGIEPPPYEINELAFPLNSYRQNSLKGDFPIFGTEDLFLNVTLTEHAFYNYRIVPTGSGITGTGPVDPAFFGEDEQEFLRNDLALTFDLFKGQQAFKPVDWRIHVTGVYTYTDLDVKEVGVTDVDVSDGTHRKENDLALQEAFVEYHICDLSDRYDFLALEAGILPFRSDFRGFIFDDVNLGARLFGNYDENKYQFNAVFFDMLDKDSNSLLNTFEDRHQNVVILNLYRQDWPVRGYTTSFSFHYNDDDRGFHFDDNGVLVTPAPVGRAQKNEVTAYYLGWAGEGHLGPINITHALYQALGEEENNPFAAREVRIDARLAALELSYDVDWTRFRLFGMYATGDDDTRDSTAEGFDAIVDAPSFAGGDLSYFNSQAIRLLGVNLTQLNSFLPDLSTSKFEGQANFVNPGVQLLGGAVDFEFTPKLRAQVGGNYLLFTDTSVIETYLQLPDVGKEIGAEMFSGLQYRPFLNNHFIVRLGYSLFFPGEGFERIYQTSHNQYSTFIDLQMTW